MMLKRHTLIPQRVEVGMGVWGGVQSVRVIDLSWGDTHGRSQQHTCMILMGGQAAGHPHLWEMDPAVRPLDRADCGGLYCTSLETQAVAVGSLDKRYDDQQYSWTTPHICRETDWNSLRDIWTQFLIFITSNVSKLIWVLVYLNRKWIFFLLINQQSTLFKCRWAHLFTGQNYLSATHV